MVIVFPFPQTNGNMEVEEKEVIEGYVFFLNCDTTLNSTVDVMWSKGQNLSLDLQVKVINNVLWFLPALELHSGNYSCFFRKENQLFEYNFSIVVTKRKCPKETEQVYLFKSSSFEFLPCERHMWEILHMDSFYNKTWTWMKDCEPFGQHDHRLQFNGISENDTAVYTCYLNFTHNGTAYTAVKDIALKVSEPSPVPQNPVVLQPQNETHYVQIGLKYKLSCKVFVGTDRMDPVEPSIPYWLVDNKHIEDYSPHMESDHSCTVEDKKVHCYCSLHILKVQPEFLNLPFTCVIRNSVGFDNGTVILEEASQGALYFGIALLVVYTLVALCFLAYHCFRVDLVLAYRKLSCCLRRQSDGKLYDAYVSYLHDKEHGTSSAKTFTKHILPEVLENQLGYRLFINGRDDPAGAAVHDVIAETVSKSRRLIVVLQSDAFDKTSDNDMPSRPLSLDDIKTTDPHISGSFSSNWSSYECWVGLFDALVKEKLQVILIQVEGEVNEAQLPESLRYIRRTQGTLVWKQKYNNKPNGKFWKQLRCRMPPIQTVRTADII